MSSIQFTSFAWVSFDHGVLGNCENKRMPPASLSVCTLEGGLTESHELKDSAGGFFSGEQTRPCYLWLLYSS